MTDQSIAFWAMIGSWVSGVATFLAVIASLYIANRKPKAHLTCKVGKRVIFGKNVLGDKIKENGLGITVVNQSIVPVKIISIGWSIGNDKYFHQILGDIHSDEIPKKLEYGEQAFFWIKMDDGDWMERFADEIIKNDGKVEKLKFVINLSTGKSFYFKPEKAFLEQISNMVKQ